MADLLPREPLLQPGLSRGGARPVRVDSPVRFRLLRALPAAASGAKGTDDDVVKVQISAKGEIAVNGRKIAYSSLEKELVLRFSKSADKTLLVEADKSVPVEKVVYALDIAKKLGAGKIGIAVADKEEK